MRTVEAVELVGELLPRRWVRKAGIVVVLVLLATHKFEDVALWYVTEKAAAVQEDVAPVLQRLVEQAHTPPGTP